MCFRNKVATLATALVFALFVFASVPQIALAQRGGCNVQQNAQQTSQAAAIERAQITSVLQAQQPLVIQSRPVGVTSATATASSGGGQVVAAPSVAALRTAGVTTSSTCNSCQQSQQALQVQSVPILVQEAPVALVATNSKSHVGILDRLRARSNTSVSKSVAITRTTSR